MLRRVIWIAAAAVALWIVYLMMVTPTPTKGAVPERPETTLLAAQLGPIPAGFASAGDSGPAHRSPG